jgi:hypothetical protein
MIGWQSIVPAGGHLQAFFVQPIEPFSAHVHVLHPSDQVSPAFRGRPSASLQRSGGGTGSAHAIAGAAHTTLPAESHWHLAAAAGHCGFGIVHDSPALKVLPSYVQPPAPEQARSVQTAPSAVHEQSLQPSGALNVPPMLVV